jgi:hypothetical protein
MMVMVMMMLMMLMMVMVMVMVMVTARQAAAQPEWHPGAHAFCASRC